MQRSHVGQAPWQDPPVGAPGARDFRDLQDRNDREALEDKVRELEAAVEKLRGIAADATSDRTSSVGRIRRTRREISALAEESWARGSRGADEHPAGAGRPHGRAAC